MNTNSNKSEFLEAEMDTVYISHEVEALLDHASKEGLIAPGEHLEE